MRRRRIAPLRQLRTGGGAAPETPKRYTEGSRSAAEATVLGGLSVTDHRSVTRPRTCRVVSIPSRSRTRPSGGRRSQPRRHTERIARAHGARVDAQIRRQRGAEERCARPRRSCSGSARSTRRSVSPVLMAELRTRLSDAPAEYALLLNRMTFHLGRWIRHGDFFGLAVAACSGARDRALVGSRSARTGGDRRSWSAAWRDGSSTTATAIRGSVGGFRSSAACRARALRAEGRCARAGSSCSAAGSLSARVSAEARLRDGVPGLVIAVATAFHVFLGTRSCGSRTSERARRVRPRTGGREGAGRRRAERSAAGGARSARSRAAIVLQLTRTGEGTGGADAESRALACARASCGVGGSVSAGLRSAARSFPEARPGGHRARARTRARTRASCAIAPTCALRRACSTCAWIDVAPLAYARSSVRAARCAGDALRRDRHRAASGRAGSPPRARCSVAGLLGPGADGVDLRPTARCRAGVVPGATGRVGCRCGRSRAL